MKLLKRFVANLMVGILALLPVYLAIVVLLKGMKSVATLVRPFTLLLPDWLPAEDLLSLLLVLFACAALGAAVRTRVGQSFKEQVETNVFERIPGYGLFKALTQQLAGKGQENVWKPALVEIEDALVPGFVIEEIGDGRLAVFVPSVPTPLAGAIYILDAARVHPLDVPFTQAIQCVTKWGLGSRALVAAMTPPRERLETEAATSVR